MKKVVKVVLVLGLAAVAALMWRDAQAAKQPVVVVYPTRPEILSAPTPAPQWWAAPTVAAEPVAPVLEAPVLPVPAKGADKVQEAPAPTPLPQKDVAKGVQELVSKAELMIRDVVNDAKDVSGKDRNK